MSRIIHLSLNEDDLNQVIDGLCVREKAWQQTAMLLRGERPHDPSVCEECNHVDEAEGLAAHYSQIIKTIVAQRDAQLSVPEQIS
jgi:hypothetical protein